jgi:hypothetical protein
MRLVSLNIVRFLFLILIQLLVVDQISLGFMENYISLVIYVSFLLTFPILGLTMDMFKDSGGIHASACLFLAFLRPFVLRRLQSQNPIDEVEELTVYTEDLKKYITYTVLLLSGFFFWLFLLEEFSFSRIPMILLKTLLSTIFSTLLIIIGQYLLFRRPKI